MHGRLGSGCTCQTIDYECLIWCRWMWCIWNISSSDWLTGRGRGFSPAVYILLFRVLYFPHYISYTIPCTTIYKQSGALSLVRSIEILCSYWLGLLCCWRQLSYSIKTQAKVPKVSIRGISCPSMCLYGIKGWLPCTERIKQGASLLLLKLSGP